jgi:glutathione S-transferase
MLTIYHVRGTRSVRPIWLCYELDLPVDVRTIDFSETYRNSSEWRAISPAGKVPAMTDGDLTMFESGAIVDYILERYGNGRLRPPLGTAESALHRQWCWFAEATLARPLGAIRLLRGRAETGEAIVADAEQKIRTCLEVVDAAVADREFLLGSRFDASDIMMGYSLALLAGNGVLDERYPHASAYLTRLRGRDACKRAMSAWRSVLNGADQAQQWSVAPRLMGEAEPNGRDDRFPCGDLVAMATREFEVAPLVRVDETRDRLFGTRWQIGMQPFGHRDAGLCDVGARVALVREDAVDHDRPGVRHHDVRAVEVAVTDSVAVRQRFHRVQYAHFEVGRERTRLDDLPDLCAHRREGRLRQCVHRRMYVRRDQAGFGAANGINEARRERPTGQLLHR